MKRIDLNDPFEKTLAKVHSLPDGGEVASDAEIEQALRGLYIAAHGRSVETTIGRIPIAPPADSSLKSKSWPLNTRTDLLILAERRRQLRARAAVGLSGVCARLESSEYRASLSRRSDVPPECLSAKINGNN
jgi:hypothetical protein